MNRLEAFAKLTQNGTRLLTEVCNGVEDVRTLTVEDIGRIVSLQDRLLYENGKWKIAGKKRKGGYLDIKEFQSTFLK